MVLKRGHLGKESEISGKFRNVVLEEDEKISRSDRVRNEDVLRRVKEERNILHAVKRREDILLTMTKLS